MQDKRDDKQVQNFYKNLAFLGLVVFLFFVYWLIWFIIFGNMAEGDSLFYGFGFASYVIWPLISFLFAGMAFALSTLLFDRPLFPFLAYFLSLLIFFLFFGFNFWYLIISLLTLTVMIINFFRMRRQRRLLLKLAVDKILRVGLPLFMTVIILLTVFVYLNNFQRQRLELTINLNRETFERLEPYLENSIKQRVPSYSYEMTVNQFLEQVVITEIIGGATENQPVSLPLLNFSELDNSNPDAVALDNLERQITEETKQQAIAEINADILESLGVKAEDNERVMDFFYKVINVQLNNIIQPIKPFLPYISSLLLFFWYKLISLFAVLACYPLSYGVIKILVKLKIIKLEKRSEQAERITV